MRLPLLALLTGLLLAAGAVPATAQADGYPIKNPRLTGNALYASGALGPAACPQRPVAPGDPVAARRYLRAVYGCLNAVWGTHLRAAGLPFERPGMAVATRAPARFCGEPWEEAAGGYCNPQRRFLILLDKDVLDDPGDLWLLDVIAHEYAHHVQNVTGLRRAFESVPYRGERELHEQTRRYELQAECLAGVFIGSVWSSLERSEEDWEELLAIVGDGGDERHAVPDHGRGRTIVSWLKRGFTAADPGACNTWSAPARRVA
ncbi:neutral zinc metallopeptidase [Nonomuraea sp. NPDC046570]|uniref:neutral zinc metallopeptidase n=1 Tax=Nonomuraea sp. NPDC046570 TaxID=3155255 RepID=UPI0033E6B740